MKNFSPIEITLPVVGFPARILVITRADGTIIRITESDEAITVDGDTYSVVPGFKVSALKHTSNGGMPSCQFTGVHAIGGTFDSNDLDIGLFDGAKVEVYNVNRLDLSRKGLAFTGTISNISTDPVGRGVVFDCKGPAAFSRKLVTERRTPMCRVDLFSPRCRLTAASYAASATVASIVDQFNFTITIGSPPADSYYNGGVAVTANDAAFVMANWVQSTLTVTTYRPSDRFLSVGLGLTLYPGCDKTLSATGCGKFSNQLNFQGDPHFLGSAAAAQQF